MVADTQAQNSLVIDEASNDMFEVDETFEKADESKNGPGNSAKPNSQNRLNRSIVTEDEDDYIPETQCDLSDDNRIIEHDDSNDDFIKVQPKAQCDLPKFVENMEDDSNDDYIKVQPDTNSYSAQIDQSQNVMRNFEVSILIGIDATKNNKSNDSINLTTSMIDDHDPEMSALKWNESTEKPGLLPKARASIASSSTPIVQNRDESITPDLDELMSGNSSSNDAIDTSADGIQVSTTPEFLSAKSFASSKEGADDKEGKGASNEVTAEKPADENEIEAEKPVQSDEKSEKGKQGEVSKQDALDDENNKEKQENRPDEQSDKENGDNEGEENDIYGACTQAFPFNSEIQDPKEISDNPIVSTKIVSNESKTDDIYDMPTQVLPEENNVEQEVNIMPPPASTKFNFKRPTSNKSLIAPSEKTIYEMATQDFTPPDDNSTLPEPDACKKDAGRFSKIA